MALTYSSIATTTLTTSTASITFSSIPSTYTDLRLVFTGLAASGAGLIRFNNDSGTNYSYVTLRDSGASAGTVYEINTNQMWLNGGDGQSSTIPTFVDVNIFSYANSNSLWKTCLNTINTDKNGSGEVLKTSYLWRSANAITSIVISNNVGNWDAGTTATLYGIKAA